MMNRASLASLALAFSAAPVFAQAPAVSLPVLLEQVVACSTPASVAERAAAFPALAALPADTDSFLVLNQLGSWASLLQSEDSMLPWKDMVDALDSMALGVTKRTVQDLQRLQPLFQVLSASQNDVVDNWVGEANDSAARAIVAVLREEYAASGEKLVQATQDFHLAPIYVTLSAKPGNEALLQQLSMLPLMLPMGTDAPIEMTVRSGWRGFCVHGHGLDLSEAELAPEHETRIRQNLEKARLYVLARTVGNKLVLVICSNLDEVKIPVKKADSILNSPLMTAFDSCLSRRTWLAGYSSPAVVQLREELNLFDYQYVASFMERVFSRLSKESAACAEAAKSVKALLEVASQVIPSPNGPERLTMWEDGSLYLHMVNQVGPYRFAPSSLHYSHLAQHPDTVCYIELTPVSGSPVLDVPAILTHIDAVQNGYKATLKPEHTHAEHDSLSYLLKKRDIVEPLAESWQLWSCALTGNGAMLVQSSDSSGSAAVSFALRGEFADAAKAEHVCSLLQKGSAWCVAGEKPVVQKEGGTVLMSCGQSSMGLAAPAASVAVPGGAFFSLNVPGLVRVLESSGNMEPAPAELHNASWLVERLEGCMSTAGDELHTVLKLDMQGINGK